MNIDYRAMKKICLAPIDSFNRYAQPFDTKDGKMFYKDNGSDVLAVAHLDSVSTCDHFTTLTVKGTPWVINAQLDDRLGAYTILELLPSMNITMDWLLTEGEEVGKSTAAYFKPPKKYNWMVEFDRHGSDVVHYQFGTEHLIKRLRRAGFTGIQHGMRSDIAYLDNLGCCGFNVGVGYMDEHSDWAKANMLVYENQMEKFIDFYAKFNGMHFKYELKPIKPIKTEVVTAYKGCYWGYNDKGHGWESYTREFCANCGDQLYYNEFDLCIKCRATHAICKICEKPANKSTLLNGACLKCQVDADHGARFFTQVRCPKCHSRQYNTEVVSGVCETCTNRAKKP